MYESDHMEFGSFFSENTLDKMAKVNVTMVLCFDQAKLACKAQTMMADKNSWIWSAIKLMFKESIPPVLDGVFNFSQKVYFKYV